MDNEKFKRNINNKSMSVKLPKIRKTINLSDVEKDIVNEKILNMKKFNYDPIGCSKSMKLEKVRLRNKIMRYSNIFDEVSFKRPPQEKLASFN
jgi:hypothetical protein